MDIVIASPPVAGKSKTRVGGADVAISYPSLASAERVATGKVEAVPAPKRLTMMPTVSIVTGCYPEIGTLLTGGEGIMRRRKSLIHYLRKL